MRPQGRRLIGLIGLLLGWLLLGSAQGALPQAWVPTVTAKHTIFDYKTDLLLTDQQEQEIRQILAGLARLTLATHELAELLKREAALRAALSYEDIAASLVCLSLVQQSWFVLLPTEPRGFLVGFSALDRL